MVLLLLGNDALDQSTKCLGRDGVDGVREMSSTFNAEFYCNDLRRLFCSVKENLGWHFGRPFFRREFAHESNSYLCIVF